MDGILLCGEKKSIRLSVADYQFPFEPGMDEYDANRLMVRVEYSDEEGTRSYTDSCVLTFELRLLLERMKKIRDGIESGYLSDYSDPYLRFAVMRVNDIFAVQMRYAHETQTGIRRDIYACQGFDAAAFSALIETFERHLSAFPTR